MTVMVAPKTSRGFCFRRLGFALLLASLGTVGVAQTVDPSLYSGLVWRNIGPFRGGRVSAVTGVIGQPGVYYMGLPLGGVWKTTSAGVTWYPIFDQIKEASCVGAIEVAPSDPNVIYVGMGDLITGGGINEGNGVYKSTDAGKTWQHMGLAETKQIPSILVDPKDPNLVMVAAQGNIRKQSEDRGLYRSTDGGKTWTKTLYVDIQTGIQKITWASDNPDVMLATTVRHYNAPGTGGGFGGNGVKLFKSTDKGLTWKEITEHGLPSLSGRTCLAIANNTKSQRMFLVGNFGLYRSDDGGENWRQMDAADRRIANGQGGYNCGVYVNTKDPDVVYVFNTCSYISRDGGNTFTGFKGAPGGDDPQQMWLDPSDGNRLFMGMDQGATVTFDGGQTWSNWYNQSTAQVYHISVDSQYPYWVYATQQDSGSIGTRSRGDLGAITPIDWLPTPAYEFGSIVADPLNPKIVYAGGPGGGIVKITYPSGQWINVSPNVESKLGLRKVGNQPLLWSRTNPRELFAGFQYLMATTDGGAHWKKLSPDLGYPKGVTPPAPTVTSQGRAGALMSREEEEEMEHEEGEQRGQGQGGAIESIAPSSVNGNVIWVGTNNGLIKLTKDHGKTWEDVTIPGLPPRSVISAVDASHHDPATAYAAVDWHGTGDLSPCFYRTHDYGKTWTKIVTGLPTDLPSGCFSRVIRADTKRQGLLFAGTESFVYVSFDDGDHWQSLAQNLPNTSYRDMVIKDNDLVVGTYGRGFWILDDISPLRQIAANMTSESARLFKPGDAIRVRRNINSDTPFPPEVPHALNPPVGAIIYYYLGSKPSKDITIEISDASGKVVRHMSSAPIQPLNEPPPPVPDFWLEKPKSLPLETGTNRINWDLRCDNPPAFSHSYEINANPGQTPISPEGPLVPPGVYTVALNVDGKIYKQTVTVTNDPRSPAKTSEIKAQYATQSKLYDCARLAWDNYHQVAAMRAAAAEAAKANPAPELAEAVSAFDSKLAAIGGTAGGGGRRFGGGGGGGATTTTFAALTGTLVRQMSLLDSGDMAPNEPLSRACLAACSEFDKVMASWKDVQAKDLPAFNAVLAKYSLKPIAVASVQQPGRH
jgi:photosystem II stability/assembly factor-like uncharacterized protein